MPSRPLHKKDTATKRKKRTFPPRIGIALLTFGIVSGLVLGFLAYGDHVAEEHRRMSTWDGILIWAGDAVALFWTIVYFVRHTIFGVPFVERSVTIESGRRLCFAALVTILASMGADLWATLSVRETEREEFAASVKTTGTIHSAQKMHLGDYDHYALDCSYDDQNGNRHTTTFYLRDPKELPNLRVATAQAVRQSQFPAPIEIRFNKDRPPQAWLADLGWFAETRLFHHSLLNFALQSVTALVFFLKLAWETHELGRLPWYYDMHGPWLLFAAMFPVIVFSILKFILGMPLF